jgi:hypothetical protein
MYVLAPNQTVETFPYSIGDLRRDNPGTSFPAVPSSQTLAEWHVFPVIEEPAPAYNAVTQNCTQLSPALLAGRWTVTWQVTNATTEEVSHRIRGNADYPAFWDALLTSTVYGSIRTQSMASLPMNTLATEFIALLGDAKAGCPNEAAIQASMEALLTTGTFTQDHLTELGEALEAGKLDGIYTLI